MKQLGVIILAHSALHRVGQMARYWSKNGAAVVVHVDAKVEQGAFDALKTGLEDLPDVRFSPRRDCTWGTWSLVKATIDAAEEMLAAFPDVAHVQLTSGTCIPVRPVKYLTNFLAAQPDTDFIESVATADVPWAVSGLEEERFTLYFPFSWKKHRKLFDRSVSLQRMLRIRRHIPVGLVPHLGSQWWCLTRRTLEAILSDPERSRYERYFRHVWIPDEGYFQTLVRKHGRQIESRSLTFSKFDSQGRPHTFYDDHLHLLTHSGYFLARKVWPDANKLYQHFLTRRTLPASEIETSPANVDQILTKAAGRRSTGRPGLYMQSRFPPRGMLRQRTAGPYIVLEGYRALFPEFDTWFTRVTGVRLHGHLFARHRVEFQDNQPQFAGCLSDHPKLRDYDPEAFLANLIWNTRGETQAFHFGPEDRQKITVPLAYDENARVGLITGAWALTLHHRDLSFVDKRRLAAQYQKIEAKHLAEFHQPESNAKLHSISLDVAIRDPRRALSDLLSHLGYRTEIAPTEFPMIADTTGLTDFLQELKNAGLRLHLVGNVRDSVAAPTTLPVARVPRSRKTGT